MKRIISLLFVCLICFALTVPCFAAKFENPAVIDSAEYLNESQLEELTEKLDKIRQKHNADVAVVTEYEMSGSDEMTTADDIYDILGYGANDGDDGILFYICTEPRRFHITTCGKATEIFNDDDLERMSDAVKSYLQNNDYYGAMCEFADLADEILERGEEKNYLLIIGCGLIIPLIIAWIMMSMKVAKMKTAVENDYAANYMKPGSKRLDVSRDIFLYSHITKTEKPKSNSSTHTSSSGKTHGGSGGSY